MITFAAYFIFNMNKFEQLGLQAEIVNAVNDMGFEAPSEVQAQAIPILLDQETDLVALAQTGTGKTAAFGFPLIQKINVDSKQTQGLILSPTRELCLQIANELKNYSKYLKQLNVVAIYGGASINEYLAVEVQYADFGETTLSGNVNDTFVFEGTTFQFLTTAELALDGDSFGFSAVAGYDINEYVRPYVRLGGHQWDSSFSIAAGGLSATIADDDGFDIFYGFGIKIAISEQFAAVAEYENYKFDEEDVQLFTAGIQIIF